MEKRVALDGEQRGFIVEEVQRQIAPLSKTVALMDKTLRSLYSNGLGGPPGYLEVARAEDKSKMDEFLAMKREDHERLKVVENKLFAQDVATKTLAGVNASESGKRKSFRDWATLIFLALATMAAIFSGYTAWHESHRPLGTGIGVMESHPGL